MASCDFKFVANPVAVRIIQAVSITVVAFRRKRSVAVASAFSNAVTATYAALIQFQARSVVVCRIGVVVTSRIVGTTCYFEFITRAVAVRVVQAVAIAVVTIRRKRTVAVASAIGNAVTATYAAFIQLQARAVVVRRISVVVTSRIVGTTCYFEFIARTVAV